MKVFDFTNIARGNQIAEVHYINAWGAAWHPLDETPKDGEFWEIRGYMYCAHLYAEREDTWYIPATLVGQFGVEAICFCTGLRDDKWRWRFMCTKEWARQHPLPSTFAALMAG